MQPPPSQDLLDRLPSVTELLKHPRVVTWLEEYPRTLVTNNLRRALARQRTALLAHPAPTSPPSPTPTPDSILAQTDTLLTQAIAPQLTEAINATGVILHTGLGRAVLPECVIDSIGPELKGYVNLAVDRESGDRIERDELVEDLLTELTGAEAATVVNNNAAATLLVLASLATDREVIVSRGQLVEIGGSFRLPEVMAQSGAHLVEVGATNRTHLKDYQKAVTDQTSAILRVHPSNYRIVGFTKEVPLPDLAQVTRNRDILLIDDLGAGALVDLRRFGLPQEPTVAESIAQGADIVLFSSDKLIGAGQGGIIVGRKPLIERIRKHPLMRAVRVDKTCLLVLERTLHLFRRPERLIELHPTFRMAALPVEELEDRARRWVEALQTSAPRVEARIGPGLAYLGSGTLPTETIPSVRVTLHIVGLSAHDLARALRLDPAAVFTRIEEDAVHLDLRTLTEPQLPRITEALQRIAP